MIIYLGNFDNDIASPYSLCVCVRERIDVVSYKNLTHFTIHKGFEFLFGERHAEVHTYHLRVLI